MKEKHCYGCCYGCGSDNLELLKRQQFCAYETYEKDKVRCFFSRRELLFCNNCLLLEEVIEGRQIYCLYGFLYTKDRQGRLNDLILDDLDDLDIGQFTQVMQPWLEYIED